MPFLCSLFPSQLEKASFSVFVCFFFKKKLNSSFFCCFFVVVVVVVKIGFCFLFLFFVFSIWSRSSPPQCFRFWRGCVSAGAPQTGSGTPSPATTETQTQTQTQTQTRTETETETETETATGVTCIPSRIDAFKNTEEGLSSLRKIRNREVTVLSEWSHTNKFTTLVVKVKVKVLVGW